MDDAEAGDDRLKKLALAKKRLQKFQRQNALPSSQAATDTQAADQDAQLTNTVSTGPVSSSLVLLQQELDNKSAELRKMRSTLTTLEQTQNELQRKLQAKQQTIDVLVSEKGELAAAKEKQEREKINQQESIASLQQQLSSALARTQQVGEKPSNFQNEVAVLQRQLDEERRLRAQTTALNEDLNSQLQTQRAMVVDLGKQLSQLRQDAATNVVLASRENSSTLQLIQQKEQLEQLFTARERDLQHAEGEIATLKAKLESIQKQLEHDQNERQRLVDERQRLVEASDGYQAQLSESLRQNQQLQRELTALSAERERLKTLPVQLANEHATLESKQIVISQLQQEVDRLAEDSRERSRLSNRLRESMEHSERLTVDNRKLYEQLNELRERFVQITNEKMELTDKLFTEEGRVKQLVQLTEQQQLQLQLQPKQDQIQSSLSDEVVKRLQEQVLALTQMVTSLEHEKAVFESQQLPNSIIKSALVQAAPSSLLPQSSKEHHVNGDQNDAQTNRLGEDLTLLKAERDLLMKHLEDERYTTERLRMEIDTIPDYIGMYHRERSALKAKFLDQERLLSDLTMVHEKTIKQLVQAKETLDNVALENKQLRVQLQQQLSHNPDGMNGSSDPGALMVSFASGSNPDTDAILQGLKTEPRMPLHQHGPLPSMGPRVLSFPPCTHCMGISFYV